MLWFYFGLLLVVRVNVYVKRLGEFIVTLTLLSETILSFVGVIKRLDEFKVSLAVLGEVILLFVRALHTFIIIHLLYFK